MGAGQRCDHEGCVLCRAWRCVYALTCLLAVLALVALVAIVVQVNASGSVCGNAFNCMMRVLNEQDAFCLGQVTCSDACQDLDAIIEASLANDAVWSTCGVTGDLARALAKYQRTALVEHFVSNAGCGSDSVFHSHSPREPSAPFARDRRPR